MTESNTDPFIIKKTQESLGKFIKKPVLTEKLLKRPPFRFLHDIINSVIKETGYFDGLYTTEELNSENIKDRDGKMQFLQKLIDVIKIVLNDDISSIRTSKIVAGHEAEKTNELLQAIGKIIEQKIDLNEAIKLVKTGKQTKSKSKVKNESDNKTPSHIQNEKKSKEKVEKIKEPIEKQKLKKSITDNNNLPKSNEKKKIENKITKIKTTNKVKEKINDDKQKISKQRTQSIDKNVNKDKKIHEKSKEKSKLIEKDNKLLEDNNFKTVDKNNTSNIEPNKQDLNENNPVKEIENYDKKRRKSSNSSFAEINSLELIKEKEQIQTPEEKSSKSDSRKNSLQSIIEQKSENNEKKSSNIQKSTDDISSSKTTNYKNERKLSNTTNVMEEEVLQTSKPEPLLKDSEKNLKRQSTFIRENSNDDESRIRPKTSLRPPSVRPVSSRPGAPRRRDKNVEIVLEPNDQVKMAGINVKLENFNTELEDDGENLVIIENTENQNENQLSKETNNEINENSQQGHLVQQILETQKELIQTNNDEIKSETEIDIGTIQKRQNSAKQVDSLRDIIQNLTRSINPLGKLMDFIPEDIDTMQLELTMWRDAYLQADNELKKEKILTQSAIEPLKNQLQELDINIKECIQMINSTRAKILNNSHKISSLLLEQ